MLLTLDFEISVLRSSGSIGILAILVGTVVVLPCLFPYLLYKDLIDEHVHLDGASLQEEFLPPFKC